MEHNCAASGTQLNPIIIRKQKNSRLRNVAEADLKSAAVISDLAVDIIADRVASDGRSPFASAPDFDSRRLVVYDARDLRTSP